MLKSKKNRIIICSIAAASLIVIIAAAIIFNQGHPKEEIKLIFKTEIEVSKDSELTTDLLIEETNAEHVKIVSGDTSKTGEVSITVEASLKGSRKDFSTDITVKKKENSEKKDNASNDVNKDDEQTSSSTTDDKVSENSTKKEDKEKNSNSSNNQTSNSDESHNQQNKPQDNPKNEDKNDSPSVKPEPDSDPVEKLSDSQYAAQVFNLINTYRTSQGLPTLGTNGTVQSIANLRASDMASMGYASHTRPDGTVADYMWIKNNYGIKAGGEDVFGGSQSFLPEAVVDSFINSPGHRAPIVSDMNKFMAVGVRYSGGQVYVSVNFQQ